MTTTPDQHTLPRFGAVYSKAPLRLGLAGGGTDVSPYTDLFGGVVLNATISLFAHAWIEPLAGSMIHLSDVDSGESAILPAGQLLPIDGSLDLLKGVYNHFYQQYGWPFSGLKITVSVDTPLGSGLGTSSTLVVALIAAFARLLKIKLGRHAIAALAYDIERKQLGFAGGRQDQYAASFGGINCMEFLPTGEVRVKPVKISGDLASMLERNLVLYYTGHSRQSGIIIKEQQKNVLDNNTASVEAMHHLKAQALSMRDVLETGQPDGIGGLFDYGFAEKKKMAGGISNPTIDHIYTTAQKAGATGGKISGAGGGGFMFFYCPNGTRQAVVDALETLNGQVWDFGFTNTGVKSFTLMAGKKQPL